MIEYSERTCFLCELCNKEFLTEEEFYDHLSSHTKREVQTLKDIATKKLKMTEKEIKEYNVELALSSMEKSQ